MAKPSDSEKSIPQRIIIPTVEVSVEPVLKPEIKTLEIDSPRGMPQNVWQNWSNQAIETSPQKLNGSSLIIKIKKRDGMIAEFDKSKIRIAMEKAARAVNPNIDLKQFEVIADHAVRHIEIKFKNKIPDVESVQDLVEQTLMEYGLFEIAKAYILYRAGRSKLRQAKKTLPIEVEKPDIHFVDRHGQQKPLNREKIMQLFSDVSFDIIADIDLNKLVEHCEANIYDGVSQNDFTTALVMTARAFIEKDSAYSILTTRLALNNLYQEIFDVSSVSDFDHVYRQSFIDNINFAVNTGRLDSRMLNFDLDKLAALIDPKRDSLLEYLGFQTLYDRYFLRDQGGNRVLETPQAFWMRVAMGIAIVENQNIEDWAKKFYDVISLMHYVPSTPTLFHSGTTFPQLSSCYLNTVEDDLHHIFKVYSDNAQLSKYSGGIGTDWSNLRATGALIKKTNVGSQGVIPFLKIANDVTVAINRSGKRRGATAVYLETWHYDFEDFLDLRKNTGDERRRTHDMNTANWVPDLFIKRVIDDKLWTLFSPDEAPELHHLYGRAFEQKYIEYEKKCDRGEIKLFKRLPAKQLWRKIITMMFETGHPWMTFKDPSNIRSPQDHAGVVHNSNLCTEITLNTSAEETAVCNLGSINLARHIVSGELDRDMLANTTKIAMRMLDNVIDVNYYPTYEAKFANLRHRPVGLGIMGFQDALFLQRIEFDSPQAVEFADQSMEFIAYHAILGSSELAKERGTYETYFGSKWDRGIFPIDTLDFLEQERGMPIPVDRTSRLDWTPVRQQVAKYGMRNSNTMAIAPTATISNISGCFPCIEPIYSNLYVKSNMSGEFTIVNKYLVNELKRLGLWNETMLEEIKRNDGNIAEITSIPPGLRALYKSAFDISPENLVKIAAYRGKWIDQSQSLNIFYGGSSGRRLGDIYMLAWHLGLKTTYYLRTLGATAIEKSTLDLNKSPEDKPFQPELPPKTPDLNLDNHIVETETFNQPNPKPVTTIKRQTPLPAPNVSVFGGQACPLDDPDCEACQ